MVSMNVSLLNSLLPSFSFQHCLGNHGAGLLIRLGNGLLNLKPPFIVACFPGLANNFVGLHVGSLNALHGRLFCLSYGLRAGCLQPPDLIKGLWSGIHEFSALTNITGKHPERKTRSATLPIIHWPEQDRP